MSDYTPHDPASGAPMRWSSGSPQAPVGSHVPSPDVQATMQQMTEQLQTVIDAAERAAEAIRYDAEEQARRHLAEAQRKADRLTAERVGLISELTDDLIRHAANVRDHSERMVRALEDAIHSVTDKLEQPGMTDPFRDAPPPPSLARTPLRPAAEPALSPPPTPPPPAAVPPPPPAAPPAPAIPSSPAQEPGPGAGSEPGPARPVSYTDLIGAPPPPPPAFTAPVPPSQPAPDPDVPDEVPSPEPTEEIESAASSGEPEVPLDAILYATRLAVNGTDPAVIATELSNRYGIEDPDPIVQRVIGNP